MYPFLLADHWAATDTQHDRQPVIRADVPLPVCVVL